MFLPKIPYQDRKVRQQTVRFGGLNLNDTRDSGQFANTSGVSTRLYPVLSPRLGRAMNNHYPSATTIYAYDGLIVVNGTDLYYDGEKVGTVSEGKKQFAVVNTKLCIWPDKRYLDLQSLRFGLLEDSVSLPAGSVTFTANGLTVNVNEDVLGEDTTGLGYDSTSDTYATVYSSLMWDAVTGWEKSGQQEKKIENIAIGDLIIPGIPISGNYVIPTRPDGGAYTVDENDAGIFLRVTRNNVRATNTTYTWEEYSTDRVTTTSYTEVEYDPYYVGYYDKNYCDLHFTGGWKYTFNTNTGRFYVDGEPFGDLYGSKGSYLSTDGGRTMQQYWAVWDSGREQYHVSCINHGSSSTSSTSTVQGSTFYGYVYGHAGDYPRNGAQGGYWYTNRQLYSEAGTAAVSYRIVDVSQTIGLLSSKFHPGDHVTIRGCVTLPQNNTPEGSDIIVAAATARSVTFNDVEFTPGLESAGTVEIVRPIPDMDYICASNNRLWGVSSQDRTIYASALGNPASFYEYGDGEATASYAVAVGTDGNWTGICAYSGGVLCWKEDVLHKVVGSFPADYQVYEYHIPGVQDGGWDSLVVINEVLYYKGVKGVYAFNGSVPTLISAALGDRTYKYAVAGGNDLTYRISMQNPDGEWRTYVYDIQRGIWVCADALRVLSYTNLRGNVMALTSTGEIYQLDVNPAGYDSTNTEDRIPVDWTAELVPFDDQSHVTKGYTRLLLRVETEPKTWLKVYIREDEKPWRLATTITPGKPLQTVPLRLGRCDRFAVRFEGHGNVRIRSMVREFTAGSEIM